MGSWMSEMEVLSETNAPGEISRTMLTRPVIYTDNKENIIKPKICSNPKTEILLAKLDMFTKDSTDLDNIKQINELKAAITNLRINSVGLAAKLAVYTGRAILELDAGDSGVEYQKQMQGLLEIKLDETINKILDLQIEENYLSRDLYNFYAKMLKSMQSWFHMVESEYNKNTELKDSNIVFLLNKLNASLAVIVNSTY